MTTDKKDSIETKVSAILRELVKDLAPETRLNTPRRVAESLKFLTSGYHQDPKAIMHGALFECDATEMVVVKNIELYSLCEHHLLPFFGKCHIAYIPNGKIIGLSKVARFVDMFSRRLQTQEHLAKQLGEALQDVTNALGVGVIIECQHLCMTMRGVEKQDAHMSTIFTLGKIKDNHETREEFFKLVGNS